MSYETAQRQNLGQIKKKMYPIFSGGYVDNCSNFDLFATMSPYLRNCRFDWSDIVIRPWHILLTALTTGYVPKWIWAYLRDDPSGDRLVVRHNQSANHKLVTITAAWAVTSIDTSTSIASDNKMRFINKGDKIFCMNGSDQLGKLYGTTYSTVSTGFAKVTRNSSGLSDIHAYWGNTTHTFLITIDAVGTTDTFKRTIDGWWWATGVAITGGYQTLSNGLSIKFDNITWHTLNDNWTVATSATANPAFWVVFNSSMFVAWVPWNTDTVFKSVGNIYDDFSNIGSDTFTFPEPVTWLAVTNQALFYFTKNTVAVTATSDIANTNGIVSYNNRWLAVVEWADNHDCIVSVGNNVYYLNSALQINQIATWQNINGFECTSLSQRPMAGCSKLLDSIDRDQTGSYGEYVAWPSLVKRHLKSTWSIYPDIVLIYDTVKDKFLVDNNKYFNGWVDFHQQHYSISAVEPKVFKDEYGTDDDDSPIPFEYWTKEYPITDATLKKIIWEMRTLLDINELCSLTQEIWLDWILKDTKVIDKNSLLKLKVWGIGIDAIGTYAVWEDGIDNSINKPVIDDDYQELVVMRTKGNLNIRFKKMQIRWYTTTLAAKCRMKTVSIKMEQLDPLTCLLTP